MSHVVLEALASAGSEGLSIAEIRQIVEEGLGDQVAASSVKNYLAKNCRGSTPLFERLARGRYRVVGQE